MADANNPQVITSAHDWRGRKGTPLELPSGNTALVRSPGIQHFLKTGQIPNSLASLIRKAMGGDEKAKLESLFESEDDLVKMLDLFDHILLQVVIEPDVKIAPVWTDDDASKGKCGQNEVGRIIPLEKRDQSVIYIDEVDLEDKLFIFQYAVGGTKDLESFRKEQEETLAAIHPS